MTIKKIQAGRISTVTADQYVGEHGTIFYNEELGDLRLSDGITFGGIPLTTGGSTTLPVTFEILSKNLKSYPYVINRSGAQISSVVYTAPDTTTITKTLVYSGSTIQSIQITGSLLSPYTYTKTLNYTGTNIVGASYSIA